MAKHKTEKRLIEHLLENLSEEAWLKDGGEYDTDNKKYYVSTKGRRKVVYYTERKGLFDAEKKQYYDLKEKWERLSNNRRKPKKWTFLDDYHFNNIVTPDYYFYRQEHGATESELRHLIDVMYPNL